MAKSEASVSKVNGNDSSYQWHRQLSSQCRASRNGEHLYCQRKGTNRRQRFQFFGDIRAPLGIIGK